MSSPLLIENQIGNARLLPVSNGWSRWPWWLLVLALAGVILLWSASVDQDYQRILGPISEGVVMTVAVTLIAYPLAVGLGLILSLGRISKNFLAYQLSTLYVEVMRGLPILVVIFYVAIVTVPAVVGGIKSLGAQMVTGGLLAGIGEPLAAIRQSDVDNTFRVVIAVTLAYAAFIAELFRAGIESIDKGQMEASRALGMTYWQAMRHVILRQAIRQVLPPLGSDFIAMLKDSSLVSVLGVRDITYQARTYAASTFLFVQTYNVAAFLYLTMTLLLSLFVKWLERRMSRERA